MEGAAAIDNTPRFYGGLTYEQCRRRQTCYALLGVLGIALLGASGAALYVHRHSWVCKAGMGVGGALIIMGLFCACRWRPAHALARDDGEWARHMRDQQGVPVPRIYEGVLLDSMNQHQHHEDCAVQMPARFRELMSVVPPDERSLIRSLVYLRRVGYPMAETIEQEQWGALPAQERLRLWLAFAAEMSLSGGDATSRGVSSATTIVQALNSTYPGRVPTIEFVRLLTQDPYWSQFGREDPFPPGWGNMGHFIVNVWQSLRRGREHLDSSFAEYQVMLDQFPAQAIGLSKEIRSLVVHDQVRSWYLAAGVPDEARARLLVGWNDQLPDHLHIHLTRLLYNCFRQQIGTCDQRELPVLYQRLMQCVEILVRATQSAEYQLRFLLTIQEMFSGDHPNFAEGVQVYEQSALPGLLRQLEAQAPAAAKQ